MCVLCSVCDFNIISTMPSLFSNWKDRVIGGDINVAGTEISITKDFQARIWQCTFCYISIYFLVDVPHNSQDFF